jgi:hypothetical protein
VRIKRVNKEVQQLADLRFKLLFGHVSFLARMKFSKDKNTKDRGCMASNPSLKKLNPLPVVHEW